MIHTPVHGIPAGPVELAGAAALPEKLDRLPMDGCTIGTCRIARVGSVTTWHVGFVVQK